jgi:hypothetical protein
MASLFDNVTNFTVPGSFQHFLLPKLVWKHPHMGKIVAFFINAVTFMQIGIDLRHSTN